MYDMIKPPLISANGAVVEDRGEMSAWDVEYRVGSKVNPRIEEGIQERRRREKCLWCAVNALTLSLVSTRR